ncbi:hypothetical protein BH11VER1_BH11VER1_25840 [soil metagenome]
MDTSIEEIGGITVIRLDGWLDARSMSKVLADLLRDAHLPTIMAPDITALRFKYWHHAQG